MPYLVKKKLLHANRKDLRVNYYWLPFWQWIGLRTLIPHLARKYKKILIVQSNRQNKLRQGFFVHGHFIISYSIIFIRVTKPKYLGYFLAKISSSITAPFFPFFSFFFFLQFSFYTSHPHHNNTVQVLSLAGRTSFILLPIPQVLS